MSETPSAERKRIQAMSPKEFWASLNTRERIATVGVPIAALAAMGGIALGINALADLHEQQVISNTIHQPDPYDHTRTFEQNQ
jgi:hypothetical protein